VDSIQLGFPLVRPARADETHCLLIAFGVNDQNQSAIDGTDGDEPILFARVSFVEYLQVIVSAREENTRLLERDAMLLAIRAVLGIIPDNPHEPSIGQRPTKSMAYTISGTGQGMVEEGAKGSNVKMPVLNAHNEH
jgi:hypothetical protein